MEPSAAADKAYGNAFLDACESGDFPTMHESIASGLLSTKDRDEGLMLATGCGAKPGYVDVVTALFAAGAQITPWARNALHGEDLEQDPAMIRLFFENGLDPNAKEGRGEPLLRFMADPACAREFLSRGADPNASGPSKETPLYCAITSTNLEVAEVLLEYGATLDPNLLFTVLGYYWRGLDRELVRERIIKFLLDKGVDPNKAVSEKWGTPLHRAAFKGNENIVRMLLDAGADRTVRAAGGRYDGCTPEEVAMSWVDVDDPLHESHAVLRLLRS